VIESFDVVHNAAGPLDPPVCAAFGFNASGYPLDCVGDDRPEAGQQASGSGLWGISTAMSLACTGGEAGCGLYASFLQRSLRAGVERLGTYEYEMRFEGGGKAFRAFEDQQFMDVPFSIWRVATTGDEVQMVPFVLDGHCDTLDVFDICGDHVISGGANDPYSDWIYWNLPSDLTPGSGGYQSFVANRGEQDTEEVFARMVLVNWNGGEVPPYSADLPEMGTVFRISTSRSFNAPTLQAPGPEEGRAGGPVSFSWLGHGFDTYRLEVARDVGMTDLVASGDSVTSGTSLNVPVGGQLFWRVSGRVTGPSQVWPLNVTGSVSVEDDQLPHEYVLAAVYPNPFRERAEIAFELPEEAAVSLEIIDLLGRRVDLLLNERSFAADRHRVDWIPTSVASGVYLLRMTAGTFQATKTLVRVR
jgi:hypothetical protein